MLVVASSYGTHSIGSELERMKEWRVDHACGRINDWQMTGITEMNGSADQRRIST